MKLPVLFIYNTLLTLLLLLLAPLSLPLFLLKPRWRAGFWQRLGRVPTIAGLGERPLIWIHGASMGEMGVVRPLLAEAQRAFGPSYLYLVSALTPEGYRKATEFSGATAIFLPLDLPWFVRRVIDKYQPQIFINTETELWPNLTFLLHQSGAELYHANARLTASSLRGYLRFAGFWQQVLQCYNTIFTQSEQDYLRYQQLGIEPPVLTCAGNVKYDYTLPAPKAAEIWVQSGLPRGRLVVVAGSTRPTEEEQILTALEELVSTGKITLVLVPRHPQRAKQVAALISAQGFQVFQGYGSYDDDNGQQTGVYLVDKMGVLTGLYLVCDIALIGGGFGPWGGHNPLEAAAAGKPVIVGPHMDNCRALIELLVAGGGGIEASESLGLEVGKLVADKKLRQQMGQQAAKVIAANSGVTRRIIGQIVKGL